MDFANLLEAHINRHADVTIAALPVSVEEASSPLNPVAAAMLPNQTVPFTVQATGAAPGTYTVTLTVTDNGGLIDTYQQNITVSQEPAATTMHVGGLQGSSAPLNKRFWQARVVVTIQDAQGQPVPNATVYGTFIDVRNGATTGVTDSNGQVALTHNITNKQSSTTFRVDDVTHAALSYDPSGNIGSQITIPKP